MIDILPVAFLAGAMLLGLAAFMGIPILVMLSYGEGHWQAFLLSAAITALAGLLLTFFGHRRGFRLSPRQAFLLTTLSWVMMALFASLPMALVEHIDYTDAFFETMSGITTTGSTVLVGLERHPRGILLWRSLLQWIGGIGFIAMGVAILPFLRVGGMRLFQSESSDWSEKVTPRFGSFARAIAVIYVCLSALAWLLYWLAGMNGFDALNHAMTTISTGGYSTYDTSMGHFQSPAILWVGSIFMLLGALPFSLYVHFIHGQRGKIWADAQVRGFLAFVLFVSLALSLSLWTGGPQDFFITLTTVSFNVISVVTTTGYASSDYTQWGSLAAMVFFYLAFVGGCSGSTSGGVKIFRFQVAYITLHSQIIRQVHPHVTLAERYNNREITHDIVRSLTAFSFFFALTIGTLAMILAALDLDLVTSLTASITAVANVGPGLGPVVGPAGNFSSLPDAAKWALSVGMLLGRLEIMTVVTLFTAAYWRG